MNLKNRLLNQLQVSSRFVHFVFAHFIEDGCTYIASALAFTSLLAVVPLMSVGLAVFSSFPVFQGLADPIQNFIFENFVPASGKIVQLYLHQFTSQVSKLSIWGVTFLIVTALLVMLTIEGAMNKIWRVSASRRGVAAFLLYWAILSLAPVLLGLSLAATSYLFSMPLMISNQAPSFFLHWSPFLLSLIGFVFIYLLVPNCPVKLRDAFWGGLVAAVLFEMAKQGFAYYLSNYNTYELLYGAFATVPIFFIWVYWVWVITLLGAEISHALSVHHQRRKGHSLDGFSHAVLWLHQLWKAQHNGLGLSFNDLIDASEQPFAVDVDVMLQQLMQAGLIHASADATYRLSRDLSEVSLYDLSQALPYHLPTQNDLDHCKSSLIPEWLAVFRANNAAMKETLCIQLDALFDKI